MTVNNLQNCSVSYGGEGVAELASHFVELDLQDNLFSSWEEVNNVGIRLL